MNRAADEDGRASGAEQCDLAKHAAIARVRFQPPSHFGIARNIGGDRRRVSADHLAVAGADHEVGRLTRFLVAVQERNWQAECSGIVRRRAHGHRTVPGRPEILGRAPGRAGRWAVEEPRLAGWLVRPGRVKQRRPSIRPCGAGAAVRRTAALRIEARPIDRAADHRAKTS